MIVSSLMRLASGSLPPLYVQVTVGCGLAENGISTTAALPAFRRRLSDMSVLLNVGGAARNNKTCLARVSIITMLKRSRVGVGMNMSSKACIRQACG